MPFVSNPPRFDFGYALVHLKSGECVRRPSWPIGAYLFLERDIELQVRHGLFEGDVWPCEPVISYNAAEGLVHRLGWVPSQGDMMADDWQIMQWPDDRNDFAKHPDVTE